MSSPMGSIVCKMSLDEIQVYNQYASNVIEVNGVPIGKTTIPFELVKVRYKDRDHFIQVFYDQGSQILLTNRYCSPLVLNSVKSDKPIRIRTIKDKRCEIRQIENIFFVENWQVQGVLYPKLEMKAHTIKRLECFSPYNRNWAVQLGPDVLLYK